MEQTTYGPRMGMWFTKVNRCGYKELAWESGPEIPFLQTFRAQCLRLPASSAKGKCTQKPVNNQPGSEHTESGNCVGPKCFSGKCFENARLTGTWLWASNAELVLVRQSDTAGKCGLRSHIQTQSQILVMPLEHVPTPWTSVPSSVKWGYQSPLTGFLGRTSLPNSH